MHVQVRDALTHAVVDRNERAVGAHRLLYGASDLLHGAEQGSYVRGGQVEQGVAVLARDHEAVSVKQRVVIEERER